jgi:hypothetical protein
VPTVASYPNAATAIHTATTGTPGTAGTATGQTLPAYSLTLVTPHPNRAKTARPPAPGGPAVTTVTDRTATISWPASPPADRPIAKYELYRHNGGTREQLGETTGTSFTVRNLEPGRRHTVNVVTRDTAGGASRPSSPLTFTTTSPAAADCTVRLADTTDRGNGYVGSIDITNNTASAGTGWTLAFTWPTGWQHTDSGWNATWTQSGTTVRVTSDTTLAGGATWNVGFVASYSGPNVPGAGTFTLNGTVCTTV